MEAWNGTEKKEEVAIQEVRAKEDDILPQLVAAVNADGSRFTYLIGPRLGRTVSTEQYAFVFDTNRIETHPSAQGTIQDPNDLMHREPFVGRFRTRTDQPDRAFTFWLVNAHTDPDEVPQEVDALADAFQLMQRARPDEDDVILLGDLNASETQLGRLGQIPGIHWAIRGVMTNTRKTKAYDNIILHAGATQEYTGRWGVLDLEAHLRNLAGRRTKSLGSPPRLGGIQRLGSAGTRSIRRSIAKTAQIATRAS